MPRLERPPPPDPFGDALPTLETERLRLSHPHMEDADAVLAIFGDREAMRYWSHEPLQDLAAARRYVEGIHDGFADRSLFQWGFSEQGADTLIGTVTLYQWDRQNRRAEVGFMLSREHWGKGYAAEAVRGVFAFAFAPAGMDLHRIEADVDPANAASCRLLERLGFQKEGRLRERWFTYGRWNDSLLYGLLCSDFGTATSRTT